MPTAYCTVQYRSTSPTVLESSLRCSSRSSLRDAGPGSSPGGNTGNALGMALGIERMPPCGLRLARSALRVARTRLAYSDQ